MGFTHTMVGEWVTFMFFFYKPVVGVEMVPLTTSFGRFSQVRFRSIIKCLMSQPTELEGHGWGVEGRGVA